MRKPASNSLSPLRWPGGKTEMVALVMRLLGVVGGYCEPFAGGASVALTIRRRCPWASVWINDFDPCVVDFFTMLRDHPHDLHQRVLWLWRGFGGYEDAVEFFTSILPVLRTDRLDLMQRAAAFYLCNRLGYAGMTHKCGANGSASRRINDGLIDTLPYWSTVVDGMRITNMDYRGVFAAVDGTNALFIDPPYEHGADVSRNIYWGCPWQADDMDEFADHLLDLDRRGVRWVTTLMVSATTEFAFLDRLRTGSNAIRDIKLPVRHVLVRRPAEELLVWNFPAR